MNPMKDDWYHLWAADTTPQARAAQYKALASLRMEERARMAFEMSDNMRDIAIAGIRASHPDFNERQVLRELIRRMHGITLPE